MKYYVYELMDPRNGKVFYVGKGSGNRAYRHEQNVRNGSRRKENPKLFNKINSIIREDFSIVVRLVHWFDIEEEAYVREEELIATYGLSNLTNIALGGRGGLSGEAHPFFGKKRPEHSALLKGRKLSQETKDRISETWTDERKEKCSLAVLGEHNPFFEKVHSEQTKQKIRDKLTGRKHSDVVRKKMSDSTKGDKHPNWNKKLSDSTKQKMREAWTEERRQNHSGECHQGSKLTLTLASVIREKYAAGATYQSLSKEFGLSISTIWRAVTKMAWRQK